MRLYLLQADKKQQVIENHGEQKWQSMLDQLEDEDKIHMTYLQVLPNFLRQAAESLSEVYA
jgi:hypothetical protein